ncbi:MAG: branched-chain amino acid ABC transporter permease [Actinomycetota bacterium]
MVGRRLLVAVTVAAVAGAVPLVSRPAGSAASGVRLQGWTRTGAVPTFVPAADRLYVAVLAGAEQARSFVALDPDGSATDLVVTEAADGLLPDSARLVACALAGTLTAGGELPADEAPPVDCAVRVGVERTPTADNETPTWTVPLGAFASHWAAGAPSGVALLADVPTGSAESWRLVLDATRTRLTPGVAPAPPLGPPPPPGEGSTPAAAGAPSAGAGIPAADLSVPVPIPAALGSNPLAGPAVDASPPVGYDVNDGSAQTNPGLDPDEPGAADEPDAASGVASDDGAATTGQPHNTVAKRRVASPPAAGVVAVVLVALAGLLFATPLRRRVEIPPRALDRRSQAVGGAAAALAVTLLPLLASEVTIYKAGLVLIFAVAAVGLHVLVNWAGQLSLAHAAVIGLPAFVVIKLSEGHGISPLLLLPVGVAVGTLAGAIIALPTLRAQGLQVTLVTLAAGVAIDRFFFTKAWLVGTAGGRTAAVPALGPFRFETTRSLYPVVVAVVVVAAIATWMLLHSRLARAWFWVRDQPDAAAAFGIPVVRCRILAYACSGAFAGLAGALTVVWVQHLTAAAFPATLSLTYLVVAVLAGPGYVGGVAAAAVILEGGRLFAAGADALVVYGGPIALIATITRYQAGLNGGGRHAMDRLRSMLGRAATRRGPVRKPEPIGIGLVAGTAAVGSGFVAVALAWYHAGNTDEVWIQNQELISGGVGGLGLVLLGVGLLIRDRLTRTQRLLEHVLGGDHTVDASSEADVSDDMSAGRGPAVLRPRAASGRGQPAGAPNPATVVAER